MAEIGRPAIWNNPDDVYKDFIAYKNEKASNTIMEYNPKIKDVVEVDKPLPLMVEGFTTWKGISRDSYYEYKNNKKEFSDTFTRIEDEMQMYNNELVAAGQLNAQWFALYASTKYGYSTKQDVALSGDLNITVVDPFKPE